MMYSKHPGDRRTVEVTVVVVVGSWTSWSPFLSRDMLTSHDLRGRVGCVSSAPSSY